MAVARRFTGVALAASFALCIAVMMPGVGVTVNGATRWLGPGPLQFQPSELLKVSLILYAAFLLASRPWTVKTVKGLFKPLLLVVAAACALLMKQPDMGTTMVVCFSIGALLIAAGTPIRNLALIGGALAARGPDAGAGRALPARAPDQLPRPVLGRGRRPASRRCRRSRRSGRAASSASGLGESVQKIFYLPEAHTDMILAIIGEEVGLLGILGVVFLYAMIGYAGLRTAKHAQTRYAKLLAAGITSLILCQATLNFFAVLGLMPLTGVPLPFISYGSTNLIVLLAAMGILLNVAATGGRVGGAQRQAGPEGDRGRARCQGS